MGIPILPPEYGNDCFCFDAGKTPKYVYASFMSIIKGGQWIPGDPGPPNSIFKLTQTVGNACEWRAISGPWSLMFQMAAADTHLFCVLGMLAGFNSSAGAACKTSFANFYAACFGHKYCLGFGQAAWVTEDGIASLSDIAVDTGVLIAQETMSEFWPIDITEMMSMFVNQSDATHIHIRSET